MERGVLAFTAQEDEFLKAIVPAHRSTLLDSNGEVKQQSVSWVNVVTAWQTERIRRDVERAILPQGTKVPKELLHLQNLERDGVTKVEAGKILKSHFQVITVRDQRKVSKDAAEAQRVSENSAVLPAVVDNQQH